MLVEGETVMPVTQVALCFIDEKNLFQEFSAWLNALKIKKSNSAEVRRELRQYCRDVYGMMDNTNLNDAIARFLK
jgi:hypothetical protein